MLLPRATPIRLHLIDLSLERRWEFDCHVVTSPATGAPVAFRLQLPEQEGFVRTAGRTALALVVPVVMVCALFSPVIFLHSRHAAVDRSHVPTASSSFSDGTVRTDDDQSSTDDPDGTVDLFGNEVNDAVAKYKFDATGSLYELHSPQTEVPRLGSPKT
jgi:hypothetical protein